MFVMTMLKFNRHHRLEGLHGFAYGIVEDVVDDPQRSPAESDPLLLRRILHTLPQDVVLGNHFRDIKACLPAKQAVLRRNGICLLNLILGLERLCESIEEFRHLVINGRRIETRGAGKLLNLLTPASEQFLALVSNKGK